MENTHTTGDTTSVARPDPANEEMSGILISRKIQREGSNGKIDLEQVSVIVDGGDCLPRELTTPENNAACDGSVNVPTVTIKKDIDLETTLACIQWAVKRNTR